jgi:hypothetical protein
MMDAGPICARRVVRIGIGRYRGGTSWLTLTQKLRDGML